MDKVQFELAAEDYEALQTAINSLPQPNDKLVELMKGSKTVAEGAEGMTKEEAVARAVFAVSRGGLPDESWTDLQRQLMLADARAAIAAADKWDAEQRVRSPADQYRLDQKPMYPDAPNMGVSPGLDSAIQDELDHPPASIMEEGK